MFEFRPELCTECDICMLICAWEHHQANDLKRSRIRLQTPWRQPPRVMVCMACGERACIQSCPADALSWDGHVVVNAQRCDGCGSCEAACPVEGIHMDEETAIPLVCDTCGGNFSCVQWCPTTAIRKKGI